MKVAIISRGDEQLGGASRVAADLARVLVEAGIECDHFCTQSKLGYEGYRKSLYGGYTLRRLITKSYSLSRRAGLPEAVPFELPFAFRKLMDYDILHFHDTSTCISPLTLEALSALKPTFWTIHDCSPFTGGCLYPQMEDCQRYKTGCGGCPQLGEWPLGRRVDLTPVSLSLRKMLHGSGRVSLIAPSDWMADEAFGSGLIKSRPTVISNMIDPAIFRDHNAGKLIRERFSIDSHGPLIAFSAASLSSRRKGVEATIDIVNRLKSMDASVLMIGDPDEAVRERFGSANVRFSGYVTDRMELASLLSAADCYLATPVADNQPLAVMEALSCGTPVYGWATGGIAEMVRNGENGYVSRLRDADEVAGILASDWQSGKMAKLRKVTEATAMTAYSPSTFLSSHLELYRSAL